MEHIAESQEYGKGDFVLLDDLTLDAFMANLKLRYAWLVKAALQYEYALLRSECAIFFVLFVHFFMHGLSVVLH